MYSRFANHKRSRATLLGILTVLAAPAVAAAAESVTVQILVIRATKSNTNISKELKSLAAGLKKQFKYTGYKLIEKSARKVAIGKSWKKSLGGPYSATLTPTSVSARDVTLKLEVRRRKGAKEKKISVLTFKVAKRKSYLQGGWSLGGGDVLIIAVSAR